jgi:hypothetical protein
MSSDYSKFLSANLSNPSVEVRFFEGFNLKKLATVQYPFYTRPSSALSIAFSPTNTATMTMTITSMHTNWISNEYQRLRVVLTTTNINALATFTSQMDVLEVVFEHPTTEVSLDRCHCV